jgi:F-type H+-transporting ATPase subunit epsilon
MADNEFTVQIITPDRVFYEGSVSMVEFNTREGEIGVYKDHIPLTSVLSPGIVTLHENGGLKEAAVHSGFAQILPDKVTMLAEIAEWPDEIDVERAKRAEKRARDRIARHDKNLDLVRAETALRKSLVRQNLAEYR